MVNIHKLEKLVQFVALSSPVPVYIMVSVIRVDRERGGGREGGREREGRREGGRERQRGGGKTKGKWVEKRRTTTNLLFVAY